MARRSSLSGAWSGAYRYPGDVMPETVFEATIEEQDGAFTGATIEPNLLGLSEGAIITADIKGVRTGRNVAFTKQCNGSGGMDHAIEYQGVADERLTRIDGRWAIRGDWSGAFFMTRVDDGEELLAEVEAATTIAASKKPP